jgi:hypothetical protein
MDLSSHLVDLLRDHDCAVIPGFGGFIARYKPASMHPVDHLLRPPSKSVGFNPALKSSDGMLLNALMRGGLSHVTASASLEAFATICAERLRNDKLVVFTHLGRLLVDADGAMRFVQEEGTNLLRDSFGLKPVQLTPVLRKPELKPRISFAEGQKHPRSGRAWLVAASILTFIAMGASLFFLNERFHGQVVGIMDDFFGTHEPKEILVGVPMPEPESLEVDWESIALTPSPPSTADTAILNPSEPKEDRADLIEDHPQEKAYFVVVGAFGSLANAKRQLERVQVSFGNAVVFKANGLNQVGVYASSDPARANDMLSDVRASFEPTAWLTKR